MLAPVQFTNITMAMAIVMVDDHGDGEDDGVKPGVMCCTGHHDDDHGDDDHGDDDHGDDEHGDDDHGDDDDDAGVQVNEEQSVKREELLQKQIKVRKLLSA